MEKISAEVNGEAYHICYHPHIKNFLIIDTHDYQHHMVKNDSDQWICINPNVLSLFLPVEQLYDCIRKALKNQG
jgi:hypothetical protein